AFMVFPVVLTALMITVHPDIFHVKELWTLFYLTLMVHLIMVVVTWASALAEFETGIAKVILALSFVWICASGAYRLKDLHDISCVNTNFEINGEGVSQNLLCGGDMPFRGL